MAHRGRLHCTARIASAFGVALILVAGASAQSWIGDSLEVQVADAHVVVRAILEASRPIKRFLTLPLSCWRRVASRP